MRRGLLPTVSARRAPRRALVLAAVLAVVLAGALAGACGRGRAAPEPPPGHGVVVKIVDGDTLRVRVAGAGEERVRLIGIDTPETHGRGGLRECFGAEASKHLGELVPPGTVVRLERDAELRDRYGRLLAYVHRADDGVFVNLRMARDGYADVLTYPPNVTHADDFVAAVAEARDAERGLWRACGSADIRIE